MPSVPEIAAGTASRTAAVVRALRRVPRRRPRRRSARRTPTRAARAARRARVPARGRRSRRPPRRGSRRARAGSRSPDRSRRGDRVELVCVVENRRLGRPRRARIVVGGDAVEQLGEPAGRRAPRARSSISRRPRWTWPSSRPSSVGVNAGPRDELERAPDVVDERGGEHQLGAQPRMELRRLAAERRDADGVLEQPARVGVVVVDGGGICGELAVGEDGAHRRGETGMGDLGRRGTRGTPASSAASRRIAGVRVSGSTSAASSVRTSSWSRSRNFSTRPSTRTASPASKRPSSSSTSFQTRASM